MTRTLEAFMERMTSRKAIPSATRRNSSALSTMPSGLSPKRFMMRSEREPWFTPTRMARPRRAHFSTRGAKRSPTRATSAAYSASEYSFTADFRPSA